jgi:hypothetical protein
MSLRTAVSAALLDLIGGWTTSCHTPCSITVTASVTGAHASHWPTDWRRPGSPSTRGVGGEHGVGSWILVGGAAEPGRQWIEIELAHPVNPWGHEGVGSITWGANLDRSAPPGDDGIVRRGAPDEATTQLGQKALRIAEALHSAHPYDQQEPPRSRDRYP